MGSQTQIALSNAQARKKVSARRSEKNGQSSGAASVSAANDTETGPLPRPLSIRPAFLPESRPEKETGEIEGPVTAQPDSPDTEAEAKPPERLREGTETGAPDLDDQHTEQTPDSAVPAESREADGAQSRDADTDGGAGDTEEDDSDLAAQALLSDDTIDESGVTDPELISLLEQLSQTIDTANQVLSETPVKLGTLGEEYAGATGTPPDETGSREERIVRRPPPAPTRAIRRTARTSAIRPGLAAALAGLFLLTAGGSYYWFSANPWLRDNGLATGLPAGSDARDGNAVTQASLTSALPPPPPLPLHKPAPEEIASLAAPSSAPASSPEAAEKQVVSVEPAAVPDAADLPQAAPAKDTPEEHGALRGPAGQPIPVRLEIPARTDDTEISVMIQGVPEEVELSSGNRIGSGTWILTDTEAAGLALLTPGDFKPRTFALEVALVKSDGKIPQSRLIDVTVEPAKTVSAPDTQPAAAPTAATAAAVAPAGFRDKGEPEEKTDAMTADPPKAPASSKLPTEEEKRFLAKAEMFLEHADVASARLVLEHAARRGSKQAMLLLAKTYDPEHLAALGVRGVKGDKAQAIAWYERASRKADQ